MNDIALSRTERLAVGLTRSVNESPLVQSLARLWSTRVLKGVIDLLSSGRLAVLGLEHLERLPADRGVLFAPNHRSFFDLFVVARAAYDHVSNCKRLYFPVRSNFWYDRWSGVALNALATGCAMYPPVFRPPEKRGATRIGLDFLARELRRPGTVAGMHPEGTRSKGADPYELLPPEQGFGRVVLLGAPSVVPVFVSGLGNSLGRELKLRLSARGRPIFVLFGAPLDLPDVSSTEAERLRTQIEVGRVALTEIGKLAEIERRLCGHG